MPNTDEANNALIDNGTIIENDNQPATEPPIQQPTIQQQPTRMESFLSVTKSLLIRAIIIYLITSFFRRSSTPTTNNTQTTSNVIARNLYPEGTQMTLHVYLSESEIFDNFNTKLFWLKSGLKYGDWSSGTQGDGTYFVEKSIPISDNIKNNGSLYLHVFLTKMGQSPDPLTNNYGHNYVSSLTKQLNRFKKLKKNNKKNLLTTKTKENIEDSKIISHWHPNLTINLITDQTTWTQGNVPPPLDQFIKFTNDGKYYKPVVFANDYWNMARDYKPLNDTLTLRLTFQPLSLFKWQLYAAQNVKNVWNFWGETTNESDEEQDTIKETLMDTNPYLLGITIGVSILHSIFELLAFKNDIQFWNNRNSFEGLSVRSVFFGVFQSLIVSLYVLDNDTNTMVKISCIIGLGIELWKIYKVVDIKFDNGRIQFKDKGSYVESSTKEYDNLAFKYLSIVCFPLLLGYGVYALFYLEHKGWYSFILDMLYGFLLTFGFIMMTPQLFINYKLQSVAHLPWRMLTYKFLNTFIDDMFAFVIKTPTMYRIGCFRDDIVFLIFLYQRWIYPVDKKRKNEFGYSEIGNTDNTDRAVVSSHITSETKKTN